MIVWLFYSFYGIFRIYGVERHAFPWVPPYLIGGLWPLNVVHVIFVVYLTVKNALLADEGLEKVMKNLSDIIGQNHSNTRVQNNGLRSFVWALRGLFLVYERAGRRPEPKKITRTNLNLKSSILSAYVRPFELSNITCCKDYRSCASAES